jgi:TRAP-type uncharacterized transport system substrate-binding protein
MKDLLSAIIRRPQNIRWRIIILLISLGIAMSLYLYLTNVITPENNFISSLISKFQEKETHTFFSGPEEGFYSKIGNALNVEINNSESSIKLDLKPTEGGYENVIKVLSNPKSYGLAQEETIKKNDFIYEDIQFITPLYLARLHILYRYDKFKGEWKFKEEKKETNPNIKISSNLNRDTTKYFSNARISTGPVGSTTRIVSSYVLNHIHNKNDLTPNVKSNSKTLALTFKESIEKLVDPNGEVDMMFFFAGAPLEKVGEILQNSNIKLMSIEPSVVAGLNKEFELNFKVTDFKDKYTKFPNKHKNISTLGSYAFLIASKDISNSDSMKLIKALEDSKLGIKGKLINPDRENEKDKFQLEEFKFYNAVKSKNTNKSWSLFQEILIFFVSVFAATAIVANFLVGILSKHKQNIYFQRICCTVDRYDNLHGGDVHTLNESLIELIEISKDFQKDYQTGGVTDEHYSFISSNLDQKINKLGNELYRKLKVSIESGNKTHLDMLKNYFSSGFINSEQYNDLKT